MVGVEGATRVPARVPAPDPWSQVSNRLGLPTVADSPMRWMGQAGQLAQPLQDRQQMPPAVVPGEGVHLVDDDGADTSEQQGMVGREADEHRLQRFRRGQQDVRRIEPDPPALGLASVTVPELRTAAQPLCILVDPRSEVVQQCLQRAQVEHRHSGPALLDHGGEDRERGRLGFAARSRSQQQRVVAVQQRIDGLALQRTQVRPA